MKFTKVRRDKDWIRLDKGKNLDSQWHFRCMWPWHGLLPLFWGVGSFPPT
jgi:hypothetical protein